MFKPENKKYLIGGLAIAALVGLYAYTTRSKSQVSASEEATGSCSDAELAEKMKAIGTPEFEGGMLKFEYLLKFMETVAKHAKLLQQRNKVVLVQKRREALAKKDEEAYSQVITEMLDQEPQLLAAVLEGASQLRGASPNATEAPTPPPSQDDVKGHHLIDVQTQPTDAAAAAKATDDAMMADETRVELDNADPFVVARTSG